MARTQITVQKLNAVNTFAEPKLFSAITTAVSATEGAEIEWNERDDKMLLLIQNSNVSTAKSVTINAGNGIQGTTDISTLIDAGKYTFIRLESGRFKNVSGEGLKGKVIITGDSADIKVACFKLP